MGTDLAKHIDCGPLIPCTKTTLQLDDTETSVQLHRLATMRHILYATLVIWEGTVERCQVRNWQARHTCCHAYSGFRLSGSQASLKGESSVS